MNLQDGSKHKQRRDLGPTEEGKETSLPNLAFSKGRGNSNKCLLKEKQMEGKLSKVKKHHCGLFHKNQQSCGFSGARALKGKENRDHITGYSRV